MKSKFARELSLVGFLVLAAVSPVVSWYMLLFVAKPANVSITAAAWFELSYVFSSANADRWWFVLWAILPVLLLATAAACYVNRPLSVTSLWTLTAVGVMLVIASAYLWPVELLPLAGTIYFAYPRRAIPAQSVTG